MSDGIDFTVPGEPRGKGRPRFNRASGRAYTPKGTLTLEAEIADAWVRAGAVRLPDGPLAVHVVAVLERPNAHWKKDGTLSAAGDRSMWPTRKPDGDNVQKAVWDSLNGKAFRDDAHIVHWTGWKRWANPGEVAHVRVRIRPMTDFSPF